MARQPRFFVPGCVIHAIQRGNNRAPMFQGHADFRCFLACLSDASARHELAIHAYVLMTNHVHLLVTPAHADSLPKTMQSIGRRYVHYFNRSRSRTGTLWEGRYRATLLDSDEYLFACMRYVELNPVRAGLVPRPEHYPWSSHRANANGELDALVQAHALYDGLGCTQARRASAYRAMFETPLSAEAVEAIRETTNKNWALGNDRFRQLAEAITGRPAAPARGVGARTRCPRRLGTPDARPAGSDR